MGSIQTTEIQENPCMHFFCVLEGLQFTKEATMEIREEIYELYRDGEYVQSYSKFQDAWDDSLHYLDDDCVEIYRIITLEERV